MMPDEKKYTKQDVDLAVIARDIAAVKETVKNIELKLEKNYVTKEELEIFEVQFKIVQRLVYGVVGLILAAVMAALVGVVIK